jgi:hypothetical protein
MGQPKQREKYLLTAGGLRSDNTSREASMAHGMQRSIAGTGVPVVVGAPLVPPVRPGPGDGRKAVALLVCGVAAAAAMVVGTQSAHSSSRAVEVVERFATLFDTGSPGAAADLLAHGEATFTWIPVLPLTEGSPGRMLLTLDRHGEEAAGVTLGRYQEFYNAVGSRVDLRRCVSTTDASDVWDSGMWIECRFVATNDLLEHLEADAGLTGTIRFGLSGGAIRAVVVDVEPRRLCGTWAFVLWLDENHPGVFDRWMGMFGGQIPTAETGRSLQRLANDFEAGCPERAGSVAWHASP